VSKKTVSFSVPARTPRARDERLADADKRSREIATAAHPDDWVRDADHRASADAPGAEDPMAVRRGRALTLDLAAERSLMEVIALSFLVPFALGWVWFLHAMTGRVRV